MFHCKEGSMKTPRNEASWVKSMEKRFAAESTVLHPKASPVKSPTPIKPQCQPAGATTGLLSDNNNTRAVHNKENSTSSRDHDRTLDDAFEDSGYLSLQNSQIDNSQGDEEDNHMQGKLPAALLVSATQHEKAPSPNNSPLKCKGRTNRSRPVSLVESSTPVGLSTRRALVYSCSSTPSADHSDCSLPLLKFQQEVCEKLAKSYQKNKRYDWSIVTKVAENHLLDRVIGRQMGLEYIDLFTSLLSRNMRVILTKILALLGDMDLISCKGVSRTWRKIICEDTAALGRCQTAEKALWESRSSQGERCCGLTRDVAVSRVVLSCMQTLASSKSQPSSSSPNCKVNRRAPPSQKSSTPNSQCSRFQEYVQAASNLKQHESLRSCKRCGSPATQMAEAQRATCIRSSCLFDFCTRCQEAFHGSTPCRTVEPRSHLIHSKTILPGSARSKRNIKRL